MVDDRELPASEAWRQKFRSTDLWMRFMDQRDAHVFKHLVLDFSSECIFYARVR